MNGFVENAEEKEVISVSPPEPKQRYFFALITVIEYNDPDVDTFWTKDEAEAEAIKFWNKVYDLEMETADELMGMEMRSGDFVWIKTILLPDTST